MKADMNLRRDQDKDQDLLLIDIGTEAHLDVSELAQIVQLESWVHT